MVVLLGCTGDADETAVDGRLARTTAPAAGGARQFAHGEPIFQNEFFVYLELRSRERDRDSIREHHSLEIDEKLFSGKTSPATFTGRVFVFILLEMEVLRRNVP